MVAMVAMSGPIRSESDKLILIQPPHDNSSIVPNWTADDSPDGRQNPVPGYVTESLYCEDRWPKFYDACHSLNNEQYPYLNGLGGQPHLKASLGACHGVCSDAPVGKAEF